MKAQTPFLQGAAAAGFSIRLATLNDLPELQALIDASVRGLSVGYLTSEQIERQLRFVTAPDTQLIRDGTYFVAIHAGDGIVAAGGWSRRRALHGGDALQGACAPGCKRTAGAGPRPSPDPSDVRPSEVEAPGIRQTIVRDCACRRRGRRISTAHSHGDTARRATLRSARLPDGSSIPGRPARWIRNTGCRDVSANPSQPSRW